MSSPNETTSRDRQKWTPGQDEALRAAVAKGGSTIVWSKVASYIPGKNNKNCRKRWYYKVANNFNNGPWSAAEDERLKYAVEAHGTKWSKVSEDVKTRNGDQCWKRWHDSLNPEINHSPWTAEEDSTLIYEVERSGRRWQDIVDRHFPSRPALAAKNRYALLQRRLDVLPELSAGHELDADAEQQGTPGDSNTEPTASASMLLSPDSIFPDADSSTSAAFLDFNSYPFNLQFNTTGSLRDTDITGNDAQTDYAIGLNNFNSSTTPPEFLSPLIIGAASLSGTSTAVAKTCQAASDDLPDCSYDSCEASVASTPSTSYNTMEASTNTSATSKKVLTVHLECSSCHFESVMDKLSNGINDMMKVGHVKTVSYSVQ